MKQITAYETEDGTVFKTEVGAARYELAEVFRVGGVDDCALAVEIISEHPEEVFRFLNMCAPEPSLPSYGALCTCGACGHDKISGEPCPVCTGGPGPDGAPVQLAPPAPPTHSCHKCGAGMPGASEGRQTCAACRTGVAP